MTKNQSNNSKPWQATVLTLFPMMFPGTLGQSLAGKALDAEIWNLDLVDIRPFGVGAHAKVDDPPFGGGDGMVIRPDVASAAINAACKNLSPDIPRVYLTPRGAPLTQKMIRSIAEAPGIMLFCARYEGLDQRVIDATPLDEISIGDYVLSGGEVAAQVLLDAVIRLLPGVMSNPEAHQNDSFENALLEHPLYTHPRDWKGNTVPEILLSGDHKRIADFRQNQAEHETKKRRPDLWRAWQRDNPKKPTK